MKSFLFTIIHKQNNLYFGVFQVFILSSSYTCSHCYCFYRTCVWFCFCYFYVDSSAVVNMKRICLFLSARMRERASRSATQIKAVDFPLKFSPFTFSSLWKGSGATTPKTTTAPVSQIDTLSFPFQPKSQLLQKSPFFIGFKLSCGYK